MVWVSWVRVYGSGLRAKATTLSKIKLFSLLVKGLYSTVRKPTMTAGSRPVEYGPFIKSQLASPGDKIFDGCVKDSHSSSFRLQKPAWKHNRLIPFHTIASHSRSRASSAHIRQSGPDSGPDFQMKTEPYRRPMPRALWWF